MAWLGKSGEPRQRVGQVPRRSPRFEVNGLTCDLGAVLDLSAEGMKVACRRKPPVSRGDVMQFSIRFGGQKLAVVGRVAWTRRASWREHRFGVQFLDLRPGLGDALVELAQHGFISGRRGGVNFTMGSETASGREARASVEIEDLYRILGVRRDADSAAIRAAYRAAARVHHPDISADPDAESKFAIIAKAYSVLIDDDKRRRYDRLFSRSAA